MKVTEEKAYFISGRNYGESFITLSLPVTARAGLVNKLKKLGCEIFLGVDLNALSVEEQIDFNRNLEKKYNQRISGGAGDYINGSVLLVIICDSDDARKIVEQTVTSILESYGFMPTAAYGMQGCVYHSLLGFGIKDAKVMRNVDTNIVKAMFGGEMDEGS